MIDMVYLIKERFKKNNIKIKDIIEFEIEQYVDESSFAPIIYLDVKTKDKKHEIDIKLTAEQVQDIKGMDGDVLTDINKFKRDILRVTNLNKLLNDKDT